MAEPRKRKPTPKRTTKDAALWERVAQVLERIEARLNTPATTFPPPPPPLPAHLHGFGSGSYQPPPPPPPPNPAQECCEQLQALVATAPSGSMLTTEDGVLVRVPPPDYAAVWTFDPNRNGGQPFWDRIAPQE